MTSFLRTVFSLDTRSIAMFRVGLGSLVIYNLWTLIPDIDAFFGRQGIFPLNLHYSTSNTWVYWSIHALNDSPLYITALFLLHAYCAFLLIIGYRTQQAAFLCWLLQISLMHRTYEISFHGDYALAAALFWAMFMPLGAQYSVDKAMAQEKIVPVRVFSIGTVGFVCQLIIIYLGCGWGKTHGFWVKDYSAIYVALGTGIHTKELGAWLCQYPSLLKVLTLFTIVLERFLILLLLVPFKIVWWRSLLIILFASLHLGIDLTMNVGWFSQIMWVMWSAVVPGAWWDWMAQKMKSATKDGIRSIYYDSDCGFCLKVVWLMKTFLILPRTAIVSSASDPAIQKLIETRNSWVVETCSGKRLFAFDGIIAVCRNSPLAFPMAGIFSVPAVSGLGTRLYAWIARHRRPLGRFTAKLMFQPLRWQQRRLVTILAAISFGYIIASTAVSFYNKSHNIKQPAILHRMRVIGFMHEWVMFAPGPPTASINFIYTLVFHPSTRMKPKEAKDDPVFINYQAGGKSPYRWRKFLDNLKKKNFERFRPYFSSYLTRQWNKANPNGPIAINVRVKYRLFNRTRRI